MQLYQKVQGQGAAAPAGSHKLAEQDVQAVSAAAYDRCKWYRWVLSSVWSILLPSSQYMQAVFRPFSRHWQDGLL